jgi:hypothetical protein
MDISRVGWSTGSGRNSAEVRDSENGGTRADTECRREHSQRGKTGLLAKCARGERHVLNQVADPAGDPRGAGLFALLGHVSKVPPGSASRSLFRHPVLHELLRFHIDVELHLVPQ